MILMIIIIIIIITITMITIVIIIIVIMMIIIKLFDAETSNPRVKFHSRVSCYIIAVLIIIAILCYV